MSVVGKRYAMAAIEVAEEDGGQSSVDALAQGLKAFANAYQSSDSLKEILSNPALKDHRHAVMEKVLSALNLSPLTTKMVNLLVARDRVEHIADIVTYVEEMADAKAKRVHAEIVSAIDLTNDQKVRIAKALEKKFAKKTEIQLSIDPEILGGLICRVGDFAIDNSVRHQLKLVEETLQSDNH